MFGTQSEITRHRKKQKNVIYKKEKSHSIVADLEMTEMIELANKDLKICIINMLRNLK